MFAGMAVAGCLKMESTVVDGVDGDMGGGRDGWFGREVSNVKAAGGKKNLRFKEVCGRNRT